MPKASPIQESFSGGEFSSLLHGRVNTDRYKTGLTTCLNYVCSTQGPLLRRPGTRYVAPTKNGGAEDPVLVRFEFSTTQAYILEFGHQYIRFYRNNAAILEGAKAITGATRANPVVITCAGHGYATGEEVEINGVGGMVELNGRRFIIGATTANTFELRGLDGSNLNGTGFGTYTGGGTVARVYTVYTAYNSADLRSLKFAQSADVLYIVHPNYAPRMLSRTGHTTWLLSPFQSQDGPYLPTNITPTTLTPSGAGGSITITASATAGINGGAGFLATDVGRVVRIKHGSTWGWARITQYVTSTSVNALVERDFGGATASAEWRLGLWSATTGYPAAVTFHEDRLMFGGVRDYPQRIDGSNTGDYTNFAPSAPDGTVGDANAIAFTLNATDVNVIRWMRSDEKGLLIGTVGAEWIVRPSQQGEALTPTNITAKPSTRHGSADLEPVQVGKSVLFVQRHKRKLRELTYLFEVDGFRAPDLTVLSEHITNGGVVQLAYTQEPQSIVWAVRADGALLGMTYERDLDALRVGWHRHILGGPGNATGGPAQVRSVAVIPSSDGTRDELWVVVRRWVGGRQVHYVEYMNKFFEEEDAQEDAFFVDCGLTYDGAPDDTISGLWHLEGEEVAVWADGAAHPNKVVQNGSITLDRPASVVQIGYAYNSDMQTLRPEAGSMDGTAQGKTKRTHRMGFILHRTLGLKFGPSFDNLTTMIFRTAADPMGEAVPLFSGVRSEVFDGDYDYDGYVCIRQDQPAPGTILAVMPQVVTQDRG